MSHKKQAHRFSRREFLQSLLALGSISASGSFLGAFSNLTVAQNDETNNDIARVAFIKTTERAEGVRRAMALLGVNPVADKQVFLKPNFNSDDPAPGSTHPEVLRAVVTQLIEMGAAGITVGDRSGMGDTRRVMQNLGVFDLADELGFETLVFDEFGADDWVHVEQPDSHWKEGFLMAGDCLNAEALVQVCCLKTHQYGGQFTMSLKNSVGMVAKQGPNNGHDYMRELHGSNFQRAMIAEINAAYQPALIVMDGVEAFISGGPAKGRKASSQVVLAGTDRVAMDAVGVALLRYHGNTTNVSKGAIFDQDQIARAVELGLGVDGPEQIELLTDDEPSQTYAHEIREILLAG
jgi:uncharacterized protein (DUF362 family)